MKTHATTRPDFAMQRSGIAPLEFVMALPVLLLLMVGITWLGFSVIGQTEVLVKARNNTWKRRFDDASKRPLYFPILLSLYDRKADFVSERARQRVDVSPMFSRLPGPEAGHTILAGSWDHKAMSFKEPPDLRLMAVAAAVGTFGNALDVGASIDDPLGLIKKIGDFTSLGDQTRRDNDAGAANVGQGGSDSGSGGGTGGVPGGDTITPQQGEADAKRQQQEKKRELQKRRDELGGQIVYTVQGEKVYPVGGELKQADDEANRLNDELYKKQLEVNAEKDAEKKKQLQADYDRLKRQQELAEIKYKRLEAEFLDVDAELKALD